MRIKWSNIYEGAGLYVDLYKNGSFIWLPCGYAVGTDHCTLLLFANYYRIYLCLLWLLMALLEAKDKELNRWKH